MGRYQEIPITRQVGSRREFRAYARALVVGIEQCEDESACDRVIRMCPLLSWTFLTNWREIRRTNGFLLVDYRRMQRVWHICRHCEEFAAVTVLLDDRVYVSVGLWQEVHLRNRSERSQIGRGWPSSILQLLLLMMRGMETA